MTILSMKETMTSAICRSGGFGLHASTRGRVSSVLLYLCGSSGSLIPGHKC
jgi:hypothetical protein